MANKKRFLTLLMFLLFPVLITGCNMSNTLLILNWGEYISEEVVEKFEEEYNCQVKVSIADSNELFYAKVKSGTTAYDLVVPSDYMIQRMYENDILQELDLSKIPNYSENIFLPGVKRIESGMFEGNEKYQIPYFWGTFGLMYNKKVPGLEKLVKEAGWEAYFNTYSTKLPEGTRVGMYNVARFAYAAAMFYNSVSPNGLDEKKSILFENTLMLQKFEEWGTDNLKKGIVSNNLDLAFVYTGDCLDMIYTKLDSGTKLEDLTFDIFIPENTIAFMDSLVMPKNARHKDLAYKFMNFMLETENAYMNASVVGYCTPLISSYNEICDYVGDDEWLTSWSKVIKTYYPDFDPITKEPIYRGTPLTNMGKDDLTILENIVYKVKANKKSE